MVLPIENTSPATLIKRFSQKPGDATGNGSSEVFQGSDTNRVDSICYFSLPFLF